MATDPKLKARAVADLVAGATVREVSKRYGIGHGTVARWGHQLRMGRETVQRSKSERNGSEPEQSGTKKAVRPRPTSAADAIRRFGEPPGQNELPRDVVFRTELERLMIAMAEAPRVLLERLARGEADSLTKEQSDSITTILKHASDAGTRLLETTAAILGPDSPGS